MPFLSWESADTTYVIVFMVVIAALLGGAVLASGWMVWRSRLRYEREIREIEKRVGLTDEEADYIVHLSNKNKLNVPTNLYTSLRTFDTLVGRDVELLMDSAAPFRDKDAVVNLAYSARAKLFPETLQLVNVAGGREAGHS